MIQITPNFCIGLPAEYSNDEYNKFVNEVNEKRFELMKKYGFKSYSDENWLKFKKEHPNYR